MFEVPLGHAVIHVGDDRKDKKTCLRMDGLIKCPNVHPERLYHPVIPFRANRKMMFCLCLTCVLTSNSGEFYYTTDETRALTATWLIDEARLAVKMGIEFWRFMRCMNIV